MDLVYRTDHGEGSLRILVEFTAEQCFKAADGVLKRYIAPFQTGKLLGNRERLREILLHAAGTIDNAAVVCTKLLHTEDGDDVLQFAVTLQQLLCAACGLVMPLTDLYQIYGRDTAAGSVVSFYAFMLMSIPMVHFVRNTISGRRRLVPDVCIALFCANALAQGAAYRLFDIRFIDMLPLTHLLLAAGVAAMLTVLLRSYREQPSQQLRLRIAAFAALGVFGVAALVLYGLLHIYWYDAIFQFGVLLFIILLFRELLGQATEDMRFHMEHRISHQMQREDRMTGLPNRRAFEEYMERIRTGEVGCRDAVLTYIRLEGLNERNDRLGLQAGDEAVIAAARCVADFCRACEDGGESVSCFRTGGNEFALIRPEPRANSGQLHRQFSAIVARYNRTCAPRARITMTYGFSRLCDEDGKSRSISAWKAEADAYLKRNETKLGGDTE